MEGLLFRAFYFEAFHKGRTFHIEEILKIYKDHEQTENPYKHTYKGS